MMKIFFKYCFTLFIFFPFSIFSQELDYHIEYLTTRNDLSSNYVTKIISDESNFKWIATENGISKYDGKSIELIKPGEEFPGLLNENIETLFKDRDNIIWIGTKSGGLSSIDPVSNKSENYNSIIGINDENTFRIFSISQDNQGRIWAGTFSNGVFVIDPVEKKLIDHFRVNESVQTIINDSKGNMWFSSQGKLNVYNLEKKKIEYYQTKQIGDIIEDKKNNRMLFIYAGGGLNQLDLETNEISLLRRFKSIFNPCLALDYKGRLWVGTWRYGLFISDEKIENFKKFNLIKPSSGKLSINYSTINHIEHSKDNSTWLSMANGGVVKLSPLNPFKTIQELSNDNAIVKKNKNIKAIFKDQDAFYLGTFAGGLIKLNNNGKTEVYGIPTSDDITQFKVNSIVKYENRILIGSNNGLYFINERKELKSLNLLFENFNLNGNLNGTASFPSIVSFFEDSKNNIWIGTQQNGLFLSKKGELFSLSKKLKKLDAIKSYDNSRRITSVKEDKFNNIWVGTYNGLFLVDKENKLIHFSDFSEFSLPKIINDLVIDEFVWIATAQGLYKLQLYYSSSEGYKLSLDKKIDKKSGLEDEFVNSIVKINDNKSNLGSYWITSIKTIVNYNDKTGGIINYGTGDNASLDISMFNLGSSYNFKDSYIYFGGIDNSYQVDLEKINQTPTRGNLLFTDLKINKNKIYPNKEYNGRVVLNKNLNYIDEVTLNHKEKSFSVGFINNDFVKGTKYAYKLIGYQDKWIDLGYKSEIDFTGLSSSFFSSGKYKLIVASSIDSVNWDNTSELLINIKPSPFLSLPALFIYLLLMLSTIFWIIRVYVERLKLKNSIDFAESKLGFFTNISHEFRTPLTLIISPLQEILNSSNLKSEINSKLINVEKNANKLLNLINELLDFRKADHGLLKVKVAYGNFRIFSHEIFLLFTEVAKSKKIDYVFKYKENQITFPFDRNKMEIVLSNLISNALKFTENGGKIVVSVGSSNGNCIFSVKDSGIGILQSDLNRIFDEYYMIKSKLKNQTPGTGIGLFLSKKIIELHHGKITVESDFGKGSEFISSLTMDPTKYREVDLNFKKSEDFSVYESENEIINLSDLSVDSKETILVVDDNKDIRTYVGSLLSSQYNIIEAENGEVGKRIALKKIPDLIISDIMMPIKDGIELCSELKKELSTSHIPIVLLTARNSTLFEVSGLESGADDYITKPFKASVIKARVKSLLENRINTRKHFLNKVRFEPVIDPNSNEDIEISFIEKAIVLVEENIQNPNFGIEKMTDYFCMSQSTLYRKIKSLTGLSLTAFIRSVRLKKAALLISTTDTKLSYICYEVGFNDYKYFRTSFKQQFGCLPSKYKTHKVQIDVINS